MKRIDTTSFLIESNAIEGIWQQSSAQLEAEIIATDKFLALDYLTAGDIEMLAQVYQSNAKLRIEKGLDVRVGNHLPPVGGEKILSLLNELLDKVNDLLISPFVAHCEYEKLHPLVDGNGRTGRTVWFWMMLKAGRDVPLPFLHTFYYQALEFYER